MYILKPNIKTIQIHLLNTKIKKIAFIISIAILTNPITISTPIMTTIPIMGTLLIITTIPIMTIPNSCPSYESKNVGSKWVN